ncbi:hypothetical protein [Comamonas sp. Z3]|uniref:hypothetical protein n=1 Tax=Comamonas sp. Z3 TaxID=2601247 RepID=UPI001652D388|nr:hypothetical protein [Comamonas sp. Z3]
MFAQPLSKAQDLWSNLMHVLFPWVRAFPGLPEEDETNTQLQKAVAEKEHQINRDA